jgi:hypothetical protein
MLSAFSMRGAKSWCTPMQVTLIDQNDRFVFKPLLYDFVADTATAWEVAPFFQQLLAPYNINFLQVCNCECQCLTHTSIIHSKNYYKLQRYLLTATPHRGRLFSEETQSEAVRRRVSRNRCATMYSHVCIYEHSFRRQRSQGLSFKNAI